MNYKEHVEQILEYIEDNLKTELNLTGLAKAACYSKYHFSRVFKQVTQLNPADYIRKRRLSDIAREIAESNCSDSEGVLWCFERDGCPRFTTPDEKGNVITDVCYFVEK